MEPAGANLGRFQSKFLLMVIPGLIASGVVASVLYAIHISRTPSSAELLTDLTPQGDGLSAEERRGLTRQMLRARRENPQEPAQVRPTPTSRPATTGTAEGAAVDARPAEKTVEKAIEKNIEKTVDAKGIPDRTPAAPPLPAVRPALVRPRPDTTAVAATPVAPVAPFVAAAPPPAVASASAAASPQAITAQPAPLPLDPTLQPPVTVNPPLGAEPEPLPRGLAANVFSSLSTLAGTAANATGNTVNWVIDLPGKAISAGGRILGGETTSGNPPAATPPSAATAPPSTVLPPATAPPKRSL